MSGTQVPKFSGTDGYCVPTKFSTMLTPNDSLIRRMVAADNSGQADCFKFGKPSGESEPMINCNSLCDFGGTLREAGNHARITLNEAGKECSLPGGDQIDMLDINCKLFGIGPPDQCANAPLKF